MKPVIPENDRMLRQTRVMNEKEEKMKSGQIILSALALGATLGWTAPQAWADGGCGAHQGPGERPCHHETMMTHHACAGDHLHHLLKHQKEIGLTDEQVMKLKAIDLDLDRARIRGEADIRVAERELQALLEDEKTDLAALETKVKQSEMLEVGVRMAGLTARRDALAVLTPEQRDKAKAAHERLRDQKKSGQHQDHGERPTRP